MSKEVEKVCRACKGTFRLHLFVVTSRGKERHGRDCRDCRRKRHNERERVSRYGREFGITVEQYEELLARQGGVCAVCRRKRPGRAGRHLAVDHCHATGRIRGLLCTHCNVTLAAIGDDVKGIQRFIDYLLGSLVPVVQKRRRQARPRQVVYVRYQLPDGRVVKKGTSGAVKVAKKSQTYYVQIRRKHIPLGTTDEQEAIRRADAMRARIESPNIQPNHVSSTSAHQAPSAISG